MTAVSPPQTDARLLSPREDNSTPRHIDQATLQQHDILTRSGDRLRKTPHEECCGYCDRYCEGKITAQKHKDILAWQEEVNQNFDEAKMSRPINRQPRLKFLKNVPLSHYVDSGDDLDSSMGSRERSRLSNWSGTPRNESDLASDFASMALVPVDGVNSSGASTGISRNHNSRGHGKDGKVVAGYVEGQHNVQENGANINDTDVSHRTMSNQLLNVLTIDDAMRFHKYRKRTGRQDPNKEEKRKISPDIVENDESTSDGESPKYLEYLGGRHTTDLRQEKYQRIIPVDSNGIPVRSVRQVLYPEYPVYEGEENGLLEGQNEQLMRAVDKVLEQKGVTNNRAHTGFFRQKSCHHPITTKPESKRFQRLNKNLHKLMEVEYLPNYKLNAKISRIRSVSSCGEKMLDERNSGNGRVMTTMSLPGSRQNTRAKAHEYRRKPATPPTNLDQSNGKENFLEMIMDMDERVIPVELD